MSTKGRPSETDVSHSFKDLKKLLRKKRSRPVSLNPTDDKGGPPSDDDLFRKGMEGVQEIRQFRDLPLYGKPDPVVTEKEDSDSSALKALRDIADGRTPLDLPSTQEYVEWIDPDWRQEIGAQLHAGKYAVQDFLDLHGSVVDEAEKEIEAFIRMSRQRGYRCVKIIHGRGLCSPAEPVLKGVVINRLSRRYRKYVAAFVTARQCDGGLGALYVLLK